MKQTILLMAVLILSTACGDTTGTNTNSKKNTPANNSGGPAPAGNAEADVTKLINDLGAALSKNDAEALGKIYADDYTLVTQTAEVTTKAKRLEEIKSGKLKFENVVFSDIKVKGYGDTAVALAKSSGKSTADGKTSEAKYQITFVAHKTSDGWRLVNAQLSTIAAAAANPDEAAKKDEGVKPTEGSAAAETAKESEKPANK